MKTGYKSPMQRVHQPATPDPMSELDKTTPPCKFCGDKHVGLHTPTFMMLRGAYVFSPQLGQEMFVLDPDVRVELMSLPNQQLALIVDMEDPTVTSATHEDCVERILVDVGLAEAEEAEDEADEEEDDL